MASARTGRACLIGWSQQSVQQPTSQNFTRNKTMCLRILDVVRELMKRRLSK